MTNQLTLKQPDHSNPSFERATADYINNFDYVVELKLGPSYGKEFKDFYEWCSIRLGNRYKDWFIMSSGKHTYKVYCRTSKWSSFLAITWIDNIV